MGSFWGGLNATAMCLGSFQGRHSAVAQLDKVVFFLLCDGNVFQEEAILIEQFNFANNTTHIQNTSQLTFCRIILPYTPSPIC